MVGVEIDMVVTDSLKALETYEKVFAIERVEVTNLPKGENEVVFNLFGVRFHLLDENLKFELKAPNHNEPQSIWFNILIQDINETYKKAIDAGFTAIQPLTELPEYGVSNAIMSDAFGYQWMLHQIHKEVSFEDRTKLWEDKREQHD